MCHFFCVCGERRTYQARNIGEVRREDDVMQGVIRKGEVSGKWRHMPRKPHKEKSSWPG